MTKSKVSLKLLIETKVKRVLFAEASKDCVEFLFYLLSLPLATVICLIGVEGMEGSLTNLYKSLENLNDTFIQPNQKKNTYLKPVLPVFRSFVPLLAFEGSSSSGKNTYKCNNCTSGYAYDSQHSCPSCGHEMSLEDGGLVKGVVTYMVMDDSFATRNSDQPLLKSVRYSACISFNSQSCCASNGCANSFLDD